MDNIVSTQSIINTASSAGIAAFQSLFTSQGVSPSFFGTTIGKLFTWADNSTDHWKSKAEKLSGLTPMQRLAWIYQSLLDGSAYLDEANTHAFMYWGHNSDKDMVHDDEPYLTYTAAKSYNDYLDANFFHGNATAQAHGGTVKRSFDLIDLTRTSDYSQQILLNQVQQLAQNSNTSNTSNSNNNSNQNNNLLTDIIIVALFVLLIFIISKIKF